MKRVVAIIVIGLLALLAAAAIYNFTENRRLRILFPAPGKLYAVKGSMMHLYCTGTGSPTVVLESGLGDDWLVWQKVQPAVAKITRVCSYDRAGLGWSDPRNGSRGALTIAEQLHELLQVADVPKPVLLVGHSAGGLYVRAFTGMYPSDVTALVLVDSSSPEAFHAFPDRSERDQLLLSRHRRAGWLWVTVASGWLRVSGDCSGPRRQGLDDYAKFAAAEACRPAYVNSWLGEWDEFESSAEDVAKLSCCGNVRLWIISRDPHLQASGSSEQNDATWDSVQEHLKTLSTRNRRIVAKGSKHYVMIDRPDIIVSKVRLLIQELHGAVAQTEDGTSVLQ